MGKCKAVRTKQWVKSNWLQSRPFPVWRCHSNRIFPPPFRSLPTSFAIQVQRLGYRCTTFRDTTWYFRTIRPAF